MRDDAPVTRERRFEVLAALAANEQAREDALSRWMDESRVLDVKRQALIAEARALAIPAADIATVLANARLGVMPITADDLP